MVLLMRDLGLPSASWGSLGGKAALVRSASLDARLLALSMLVSLAHPSQFARSWKIHFSWFEPVD